MVKSKDISDNRSYQIQIRSLGPTSNKEIVGVGFMTKPKGWDHRHYNAPYYSLSFIISGYGIYRIGEREFPLEEGAIFQRFPGVIHDTKVMSESWEECFLDFGPSLSASLTAMGLSSTSVPCGQLSEDLHRPLRFKDLFKLFEETPMEDSTRLVPPAMALAEACLRDMQLVKKGSRSPMVEEAKSILAADASRRIDLKELCAERHWNYETFRKSFRSLTGTSPHQYAIRHRMDEARLRLISRPMSSISAVALDLGYNNVYEFSRHFKQVVGVSPKNFRG